MAVTRISELTPMTNPVPSDLFIINNGNETNSINYGSLSTSVILDTQAADLVFTGSVGLSGVVTVDGVVTVNGDISFLGEVGGIGITQLSDVTIVGTPSNGQVLTWNSTEGYWEAQPAGVAPNTVVDSVNGLVGDVILDADSLDDSSTSHKFVTFGEKTAIGTAVQPGENVSSLTNDANYVASGDNISELVNDAGYLTSATSDVQSVNGATGVVVIDADDIDDTGTDHKFATATQLSLAETAVQPTDSIGSLGDVSTPGTPEVGEVLQWDGANWSAATGITTEWEVNNNAAAAYEFVGVGFAGDEQNPTIYVSRGQTYRFRKPQSGHPFAIQTEEGTDGTLYNDGITDNELGLGTLVWEVRMDAPDTLYYQCRSHALMYGEIKVR